MHFIEKSFTEGGNRVVLTICTLIRGLQFTLEHSILFKQSQFFVEIITINVKGTLGNAEDFIFYFVGITWFLADQVEGNKLKQAPFEVKVELVDLLCYKITFTSGFHTYYKNEFVFGIFKQ